MEIYHFGKSSRHLHGKSLLGLGILSPSKFEAILNHFIHQFFFLKMQINKYQMMYINRIEMDIKKVHNNKILK